MIEKLNQKIDQKDWAIKNIHPMDIYFTLFDQIPFALKLDHLADSGRPKFFRKLIEAGDMRTLMRAESYMGARKTPSLEFLVIVNEADKVILFTTGGWHTPGLLCPLENNEEIINKYLKTASEFAAKPKKPKSRGRVYMLGVKGVGMRATVAFKSFKLQSFSISIPENYTNDFIEKSKDIVSALNEKDGKGIVVLHGEPGSGKTFYLRHLCKVVKKKILYIPPALVRYMADPGFIEMLRRHPNSVLIIEDGDNIVRKRDEFQDSQDVSSILNLTDGILQDILKLQVVITFNTDIANIDQAFLRKGRLIAEHKFLPLPKEKSQALMNKLQFKVNVKEPMLLADIYNHDNPYYRAKEREGVGFKQQNNA